MVRWTSFADLVFADCAWLAFARAAELAETDVHEQFRGAWVIDDRRIQLSLDDLESGRSAVDGMKRFLGLLALQAIDGEARVVVSRPTERWVCGPASSPATSRRTGREEAPTSGMSDSGPRATTVRAEPSQSGVSGLDPLERLLASKA
jgi:hypothetical protein